MALYLNHKHDEEPTRNIVVAVTLDLMSSSSVLSGEGMREESVWQMKAQVLRGYFENTGDCQKYFVDFIEFRKENVTC